jgi:hypothetical protein
MTILVFSAHVHDVWLASEELWRRTVLWLVRQGHDVTFVAHAYPAKPAPLAELEASGAHAIYLGEAPYATKGRQFWRKVSGSRSGASRAQVRSPTCDPGGGRGDARRRPDQPGRDL